MTPPTLPDDGTDNGAWAEALSLPPWREVSPDFFQHSGARLPDGDDRSPPCSKPFHSSEVANG